MSLRIIDNKRIELTDSEWKLYQEICAAYKTNFQKGEEYFKGLFETDQNGFIIFLRPPTKNFSSMEVYMFLMNVMVHQHLGSACTLADLKMQEVTKIIQESKSVLAELKSELKNIKENKN